MHRVGRVLLAGEPPSAFFGCTIGFFAGRARTERRQASFGILRRRRGDLVASLPRGLLSKIAGPKPGPPNDLAELYFNPVLLRVSEADGSAPGVTNPVQPRW